MSIYSEKLPTLKNEILIIKSRKKRIKTHEKKMINFIFSKSEKVEFKVNEKTIILVKGDSSKGFIHLIENHYSKNDLSTMDILNLPIIFKNSLELKNNGIGNRALNVYQAFKTDKIYKLIVNEINEDKIVVTTYRKT